MKKEFDNEERLPEYDFSKGVRGKYGRDYHLISNIVVLEPDVAERFPNSEAVNQALGSLAKILDSKQAYPGHVPGQRLRPGRTLTAEAHPLGSKRGGDNSS